jgi:hypothetical protein
MSSNASAKQSGKRPPSGTRRTASRVCVLCRRALAQDDVAIEIQGVSAHVGCAAYRRRSARR